MKETLVGKTEKKSGRDIRVCSVTLGRKELSKNLFCFASNEFSAILEYGSRFLICNDFDFMSADFANWCCNQPYLI
jgi:hypothetical protein